MVEEEIGGYPVKFAVILLVFIIILIVLLLVGDKLIKLLYFVPGA